MGGGIAEDDRRGPKVGEMSDHETITFDGETQSLGLIAHPCGRHSLCAVYEDHVEPWDEATLIAWARKYGGRRAKAFDSSWVENQGSHGSCAGYAAASCLSKARVLRGLSRVDLSGAYLYSRCNGGHDSGSMLHDHMEAIAKFGACAETTVGVNQIYRSQYDTHKADAEAAKFKAWEPFAVQSRLGFFTALANGFPVECAVHVGGGFDRLDGNGFPTGGSGFGNHAVHCDDLVLIDGNLAACGQNSWGTSWGRSGRMMLDFERHLSKPWENHLAFAIRSTLDGAA